MEWLISRIRGVGYADPVEEFLSRLRGELPPLAWETAVLMAVDAGKIIQISKSEWGRLRRAVLYFGSGPERDYTTQKLVELFKSRKVKYRFRRYDWGKNFWVEVGSPTSCCHDYYALTHACIILEFNELSPWEDLLDHFSVSYLFSAEEGKDEVRLYRDAEKIRYLRELDEKRRKKP